MTTFLELQTAITDVSKNKYIVTDSDVTLAIRINNAVTEIAGGIRMPNGDISPPLPGLFSTAVVATSITAAFKTLPATYQRNVVMVSGSTGAQIFCGSRTDYYDFPLYLQQIPEKDLSEAGTVHSVCVVGTNLYYQGIPAASVNLTVLFYRAPVAMATDAATPDGIPAHLQLRLIKHKVGWELANDMVDGTAPMIEYHNYEFFRAMADLIDFISVNTADPGRFTQGAAVGDAQRRRE